MDATRVVITGIGAVSSVGNNVPDLWAALLAGKSGIGPVTRFDTTAYRTRIAGEIKGFQITQYMTEKEARRLDLFCQYAMAAAAEAVKDSGLDLAKADRDRIGVLVGSGIGGILTFEEQVTRLVAGGPGKVSPFLVPMMISDMASGAISMRYSLRGPNFGIVSACATATHSLGEAYWAIKRGDAEVMLAGGAEAPISPIALAGFCSMKAMSERNDEPLRASRPFDAQRDGFVIAEGAGVLVLESLAHAQARGATILAEFTGYAATADAHHITAPSPDGNGAARAIRHAIQRAGIAPSDVNYINAHGTSTPLNDKFETMAIKTVLGEHAKRVPVSSTKSLTGHALGAAGGIESVVCVQAIRHGMVPGTYNYENPDPDCDLDYVPNQSRKCDVRVALNLNFGFGGHNGVMVLQRYEG